MSNPSRISAEGRYHPTAVAASGVIAAYPIRLRLVTGRNTGAAARYFQLYNTTTVPADGVAPDMMPILVPAGASFSFAPDEAYFSTGCCWATSTTDATKTIGAAEMWVAATFTRQTGDRA